MGCARGVGDKITMIRYVGGVAGCLPCWPLRGYFGA